jgi:hypothetical protein
MERSESVRDRDIQLSRRGEPAADGDGTFELESDVCVRQGGEPGDHGQQQYAGVELYAAIAGWDDGAVRWLESVATGGGI